MTITGSLTDAATLRARLDDVSRALEGLQDVDVREVPAAGLHEALGRIEQVTRQLEALSAKVVSATEADGRWATSGARTFSAWLRMRTGRHSTSTARMVKQARTLRDQLPETARAFEAGTISADHVAALTRHATDTPKRIAQLSDPEMGEQFLVAQARALDATAFTTLVRHWALRADPDAADRSWKDESEREELSIAKTTGGYHVKGWLNEVSGQSVITALDARTGTPAAGDQRSRSQRRANALVSLSRLVLDSGKLQPGARIRPHLAVTVPFETLERLVQASAPSTVTGGSGSSATDVAHPSAMTRTRPAAIKPWKETDEEVIVAEINLRLMEGAAAATLPDGAPIPHTLLARLACQSQLHRVVFGPDSEILDSGREERLFTAGQTRAIIARDGHCQYPGCDAPPGEGEIHHNLWWYAHSGGTGTRNGILLCWYHHDYVHRCALTIKRLAGGWEFTRPDGSLVATGPLAH